MNITFHPTTISSDLRYPRIPCRIEGIGVAKFKFHPKPRNCFFFVRICYSLLFFEKLKTLGETGAKDPLYLTLTGSCTNSLSKMSGGKDQTTIFNCIVRSRDTKTIVIKNPSNQKWSIRPIIDGTDSNWWLGPDRVVIEPQTSKPVEFTYRPLMMTQANRKHQVKLNDYL